MTKRIFSAAFACCLINIVFAQKNDYVWLMGYNDHDNDTLINDKIDFNYSPPKVINHKRKMNFNDYTDSSICDSSGNLQFYTNGLEIRNYADQVIEGGAQFLDCLAIDYCNPIQACLSLPLPGAKAKYMILATEPKLFVTKDSAYDADGPVMSYSIDMSANNGLGAVTKARDALVLDTMTAHLTACRHANGRDWWILAPKNFSNKYYRLLLDPSGAHLKGSQSIGSITDAWGESIFSPDGAVYARMTGNSVLKNRVDVFKFDRCTGLLSSDSVILQFSTPSVLIPSYVIGIAISPNSRYLYVSKGDTLFQFDLQSVNVAASRTVAALYDGFRDEYNFPTNFGVPRLAPNGFIYMASGYTTKYMHLITEPNQAGASSEVIQRAVFLPTANLNMPNYPYFRLGPLRGGPCDTLSTPTEDMSSLKKVKIFPNPGSGALTVELESPLEREGSLTVFDITGRSVVVLTCRAGESRIYITEKLSPGMYLCSLTEGMRLVWTGKLVKI